MAIISFLLSYAIGVFLGSLLIIAILIILFPAASSITICAAWSCIMGVSREWADKITMRG